MFPAMFQTAPSPTHSVLSSDSASSTVRTAFQVNGNARWNSAICVVAFHGSCIFVSEKCLQNSASLWDITMHAGCCSWAAQHVKEETANNLPALWPWRLMDNAIETTFAISF